MQLSPVSTLRQWDAAFRSAPHSPQLTTEQLEELARAYYEGGSSASSSSGGGGTGGSAGELPKDEAQAVAVWRAAAARGSIEAKYSLAVCLREGRGCATDAVAARARLSELAGDGNADGGDADVGSGDDKKKRNKNVSNNKKGAGGYHLAHYALGIMLTSGEGGAPDHAKAFGHFKAAARAGVLPALHNLANAYAAGRGVKQSDHNALLYYQAGADAGDPHAMFSLASWLHTGRGAADGKKQPERAFELNLAAARKGHPAAMFNVGAAFMSGVGTGSEGKDMGKAAGWFEKASFEGTGRLAEASLNLGNMYRAGLVPGAGRDLVRAKAIFARGAPFSKACAAALEQVVAEEHSPSTTAAGGGQG